MRRAPVAAGLAIALLALPATDGPVAGPVAGPAAGGPAVAVVGPVATVRPSDHPSGADAATLVAARNEFESFQVVVEAGTEPLTGLSVSVAEPLHGAGAAIPARNVTVYREAYYDVHTPSDLEGAPGRWPDPLIPAVDPFYRERRNAFPVTVPAGENRVAWIDVLVTRKAAPGDYDGALIVRASGFSARVPVHLTVLALTLPSTSSLASAFGMEWDGECKAHYADRCFDDEAARWQIKSLYVRAALEDRVTISYPAFQPPSGHGSPGSESAFFRRYILPLLQGRSPDDPAGLWTRVRLPGARLTSIQVDRDPSQLAQWKLEATRGGFVARSFLYACDEPNEDAGAWRSCTQNATDAVSRWPGLHVLVTATIRNADRFGATSLTDRLVPIVNEIDDKPGASSYSGNQRPSYRSYLRADPGNRLWMYTSCESHGCSGDPGSDPYWAGWPSYAIDQPGSEARAVGWLSFEYRTTGELYYDVDYDLASAWTDQFDFGGNGDGTLFYPGTPERIGGTHDIPIESIRLKRIRDGREDYEYLRYLARHGMRGRAMEVARALFPTMYRTDVTERDLDAARAELADLVESVSGRR